MRAIIADDNSRQILYLRRILLQIGHEIIAEFDDGTGVVEACNELKPDFVVLDIKMLVKDGSEVAFELLHQPEHPLVLIASNLSQDSISRPLRDLGALFIAKPYGELFAVRLKEALENVAAARTADHLEAGRHS